MAWPILPGETPIDPSGLKIKGITTRGQLNVHEAENVRKAVVKYLAKKPSKRTARFTVSWLKKLHQEMFGDVWEWAGRFRESDGQNVGIPWVAIEEALFNLLKDLEYWRQAGMDLVEQAARLHHRAVWIHPFPNGNGRWSRLLANVWLKLNDGIPTFWPETTMGTHSTIRAAYVAAVRAADAGDFEPLLKLHREYGKDPDASAHT